MDANTADGRANPGARTVRLGDAPTLSVLLTSRGSKARLEGCLRSLAEQRVDGPVEVLVARSGDPAELDELTAAFPDVRFCAAPSGASEGDLRAVGMMAVSGDIVVLRPDDPVPEDWLAQIVESRFTRTRKGMSE